MITALSQRRLLAALTGIFFVSGFAALLYQVVWQRMLGLFAGSDVRSATIITAAYLAGLGMGSLLGGSVADRLNSRQAVRLYGLCNLGIAGFAVISRFLYYDVLFLDLQELARSPLVLLLIAFASLLIPTLLMGVSLPLLSRALVRAISSAPRLITLLYGFNTLGAGVGTLIAGWWLIGNLGYENALYLGAALSVVVAVSALVLSRQFPIADQQAEPRKPRLSFRHVPRTIWLWCALVFTSGFVAISLEILWFRVLGVSLKSNAYTFAHLLFFFLLGDSIGSLIGARFVGQIQNLRRAFLLIQVSVVMYALVSLWGMSLLADDAPLSKIIAADNSGVAQSLQDGDRTIWMLYVAVPLLVIAPPSFLIGFYFPIVQKAVQTDAHAVGQRVALVEVSNILGNTLGSVLTGLVLLERLGSVGSLRVISLLGVLFLMVLLREDFVKGKFSLGRLASPLLLIILIGAASFFPSQTVFWKRLHAAGGDPVFWVAEDSTGVSVLRGTPEIVNIYADGSHQGSIPYFRVHSFLGLFPALLHPNPQRIMVIGIGSSGTPYAVGANLRSQTIVAVEIIGSELDVLEAFAQTETGLPIKLMFSDPRYDIRVGDGRRELALSQTQFDIIEADAIRPISSHSGLLYSREFFELARSQLAEGGIMAQWMASERVKQTFLSVFPYVLNVGDFILIGSNDPIPYDPDRLLAAMEDPQIVAYLRNASIHAPMVERMQRYVPDQVTVITPETPRSTENINTDLFPKDEYYLNN